MVIYKYPLKLTDEQTIMVPVGREFIHCDVQGSQICLWAIVNPNVAEIEVQIRIVGTGIDFAGNVQHLGTVQIGGFVWHVFQERGER